MERFEWLIKGRSISRVRKNGHVYSLYFLENHEEPSIELMEDGWTLLRISARHPLFQSFAEPYTEIADALVPWGNYLLGHDASCPMCQGSTIDVEALGGPDFCCSRCGKQQLSEFIDLLLRQWMRHGGKETVVAFINGYYKEIRYSMSFFANAGDLSAMADQIWIEAFDDPFFAGTRLYAVAQKMLSFDHMDEQLAYFRSHLERKLLSINQMYTPHSPIETLGQLRKLSLSDCIRTLLEHPSQKQSKCVNGAGVRYRTFKAYELLDDTVAGNAATEQAAMEMLEAYRDCGSSTTRKNGQITAHEQPGLIRLNDGTFYPAWLTFTPDSVPGRPDKLELYFRSMPGESVEWDTMVRFLNKERHNIYPLQYRTMEPNLCAADDTAAWQELEDRHAVQKSKREGLDLI